MLLETAEANNDIVKCSLAGFHNTLSNTYINNGKLNQYFTLLHMLYIYIYTCFLSIVIVSWPHKNTSVPKLIYRSQLCFLRTCSYEDCKSLDI